MATDPTFFTKFRLRGPTLQRNFQKFKSKFQSCNLQLITFPKLYFSSKSANKCLRYHQKNTEKHWISPKNRIKKPLENHDLFQVSHVFQPFLNDISAICWPILMQESVLGGLLVVDYMTEIRM